MIGKGGSVIAELHAKHEGVRVKFSQNNDFFPGTNERVLSLTGTQGVVCNAITDIVTRVYEVIYFSLFYFYYYYITQKSSHTHLIHNSLS